MSGNKSGSRKLLTRLARRVGVLAALACVAAGGAVSANFAVKPVVIDQGGGRTASSAYALRAASIGGTVIATSSSGNYTINANITLNAGAITPPKPEHGPEPDPDKGGFVSFTGGGCAPSGSPDRTAGAPLAFAAILAFALLQWMGTRRRAAS